MTNQILTKKDVEILDSLLDTAITKVEFTSNVFPDFDNLLLQISNNEIRVDEYKKYYFEILKSYNVLDFEDYDKPLEFKIIPVRTKRFIENGGFRFIYNEQQQEIRKKKKLDKMTEEKLAWDLQLSKFQVKAKLWPYILSFLSFIISIISLFI